MSLFSALAFVQVLSFVCVEASVHDYATERFIPKGNIVLSMEVELRLSSCIDQSLMNDQSPTFCKDSRIFFFFSRRNKTVKLSMHVPYLPNQVLSFVCVEASVHDYATERFIPKGNIVLSMEVELRLSSCIDQSLMNDQSPTFCKDSRIFFFFSRRNKTVKLSMHVPYLPNSFFKPIFIIQVQLEV